MKDYDVIVVGSGAGAIIVEQALIHDLKVALVEKVPHQRYAYPSGHAWGDTGDNTKPQGAAVKSYKSRLIWKE